jgi:hypothetical protein
MKLDDLNLGITSVYLDGFDTAEIIRPQPPTAHDLGQRRTDDLTATAASATASGKRHSRQFGVRDDGGVGTR